MSIRFAESFVRAILCKHVHRMGSLSENLVMVGVQDGKSISSGVSRCMQSHRICLLTAVMPNLDLLGSLRLTSCWMHKARRPAAQECWPAVIAACMATIHWLSMWDFVRSLEFISRRNLLSSGTSSGNVSANSSIATHMVSSDLLRRYPQILLPSAKL